LSGELFAKSCNKLNRQMVNGSKHKSPRKGFKTCHTSGEVLMMTVETYVRDAFLAALMLTGTIEGAEHAVSGAIATSGCGGGMPELLVATAKCAVLQLREERLRHAEIPSSLPPELQRVFLLRWVSRNCFVLRMLLGFTAEISSEILNLDRSEFDEALRCALSDLPRLAGIQSTLTCPS
jgi:hypothetical protein